ncbi:hypothetical protein Trydic_g9196 [Trypoxylus dichotomus]
MFNWSIVSSDYFAPYSRRDDSDWSTWSPYTGNGIEMDVACVPLRQTKVYWRITLGNDAILLRISFKLVDTIATNEKKAS